MQRTNLYRLVQRIRGVWDSPGTSPACQAQIAEGQRCPRVPLHDIERTIGEMHALVRGQGADLVVLNLDFAETFAVGASRHAAEAGGIPFIDFVQRFHDDERKAQEARAAVLGIF